MKKRKIRIFNNIDPRVYISFAVLFLIGLIIFIYQYWQHVDCENANYVIKADEFAINKVIEFYDNTPGARSWQWDFGDSTAIDKRQQTLHKYKKPGEYIVRLKINGSCIQEKSITITSIGQQVGYLPRIVSPNVAFVGDYVQFDAEKEGGESWEWSFGETSQLDAVGKTPAYKFRTPGEKRITLIVNGDVEHIATKTVYVAPKTIKARNHLDIKSYEFEKQPPTFVLPRGNPQKDPLEDMLTYLPVSPKSKSKKDSVIAEKLAPEISNEKFQALLYQVAAQVKTKDDFKDYVCSNYDLPVVINDDKMLSFAEFCKGIEGKKIKIGALRINKSTNNCIQNINIHYKVKKWMIWMKE